MQSPTRIIAAIAVLGLVMGCTGQTGPRGDTGQTGDTGAADQTGAQGKPGPADSGRGGDMLPAASPVPHGTPTPVPPPTRQTATAAPSGTPPQPATPSAAPSTTPAAPTELPLPNTPAPTPLPPTVAPSATLLALTPIPTIVPRPTATPEEPVELIEGVPICLSHDPKKWHGLVERDSNKAITCTYGHTHMDDPRVLDSIFGPLAQEISYPWQTSSALGLENDAKHRVYDWMANQDLPCKTPGNVPGLSFDNMRVEAHADGNSGAAVRFHSFFVQATGCDTADPSYRGTITTGGHMDYGRLLVKQAAGGALWVPLPGDPEGQFGGNREHGQPTQFQSDMSWYGIHGIISGIGVRKEDWGPVDPNDPKKLLFYGRDQNGSWIEPVHLLAVAITPQWDTRDGASDGYANFDGFTDRFGAVVPSCAPLGPDCVPLKLVNMKVGNYVFRADVAGLRPRDFDVKSPVTGKSLIVWPN